LAILHEPNFLPADIELKGIAAAAQTTGVQVFPVGVSNFSELEGAVAEIMQGSPQALFVGSSGWYEDQYQRILEVSSKTRLPTLFVRREFADAGGLMSYGVSYLTMYRTAAEYIKRVLTGTNPNELPVQYPTRTEYVINFKTAKTMGLTIPIVAQTAADDVIE
jgi:putative ABC transport system substrate-binding protein